MNLIIDLGNTTIKWAVFEGKNLIFRDKFDYTNLKEGITAMKEFNIEYLAYSAVVSVPIELNQFFSECDFVLSINDFTVAPIKNAYETPHTLGLDRLVNAVAANSVFSSDNVLVIDCGTCLKIDFTSNKNGFEGGAIAPGLRMRYKALNHFTHQLPLLEPCQFDCLTGKNTNDSIHNGVMLGMANEIFGAINRYSNLYPDLKLIITGGDYHYFQDIIEKKTIFVEPDLTLKGINLLLLHNIE